MKAWSIQKRILLITFLPCLLTSLLLAALLSGQRSTDIREHSEDQARAMSQQIALGGSYLLDHQQELRNYLDLPMVRAVATYAPDLTPLAAAGPHMLLPREETIQIISDQHIQTTDTTLRINTPVYDASSNLLGWVEVEYDMTGADLRRYQTLFGVLLTLFICLMIAAYLAVRASQRITEPLEEIALSLEKLENGDLDARIRVDAHHEFSLLASGINAMANSLQASQKELQDNIEQATHDLKETMETLEVQNIELDMARKEALDASRIKSEFLANMSHEIRTPLNGILGFINLLHKTPLSKRQQDYLATIESSSGSLLTIINDILDFSKIEAGKLALDNVPIMLQDVVDEVLTMLAPEAQAKGIELVGLVYDDVPHEVMGDPVRLKQVFTNLVSNAVKFTDAGQVVIRVMQEDETRKKVTLRCQVSDTGIGLSEQQKERLFKAFSQADTSTTRKFGGTGLGLVISKYLVDHMGGEIGLESAPGKGSTFWFTCQLERSEHHEPTSNLHFAGETVALFCPWQTSAQALGHSLSRLGLDPIPCPSLEELLDQAENCHFIFCELNELELRNDALMQRLKPHRQRLIILLRHNNESQLDRLAELGFSQYLTLPVAERKLLSLLGEMVAPQTSETPPGPALLDNQIRVLAVDDNGPNLKLLSTWLADMHVNVTCARGGIEATRLAAAEHFHLIFMDIQMPDLDGIAACRIIRSAGNPNSDTPIVALTAHALSSEKKALLQSGFDDYLTKPMGEKQLSHVLMKWTHFQHNEDTSGPVLPLSLENVGPVSLAESLKLAGNRQGLAEEMLAGLLNEIEKVSHLLGTDTSSDELLAAVHKLHGACRYTGVCALRDATFKLESRLKTHPQQCLREQAALKEAMGEVKFWMSHNPWRELLEVEGGKLNAENDL